MHGNRLHVELSTDDGATWDSIWNLAGIKRQGPYIREPQWTAL